LSIYYGNWYIGLKSSRSYEKYEKKGNRFGGLKAPKNPVSVGEEYIVTIEETSKSGTGVAKIRGFAVLVNNSNLGERVKIRIRHVSRNHAVADVMSNNITK
jgi:predicted RNA-binding protein with TRAM domain